MTPSDPVHHHLEPTEPRPATDRPATDRPATDRPADRRDGDGFVLTLDDDTTVWGRRVVLTTGLVDELPHVPGLADRWGRDVVHCPYCHGWEVRDRAIGVLATSPAGLHHAGLFRQLSDRVTYLAHTGPDLDAADLATLAAQEVDVVHGEVVEVEVRADAVAGVRLADGRRVELEVLAVAPRFVARSDLLADLGLEAVDHPSGAGVHVAADPTGRTAVPGVWMAGNVADPMAQVISAAAQGNMAGAVVNADLVAADTARARTREVA